MVAAKKLYPDATLVFPGSQEKNVRDYMEQTYFQTPYRKLKGLDHNAIRQVVVVDACTRSRIGLFADLADRDDVKVHLYDHHVSSAIDIPYDHAVVRERGSTVTVFTELLREKGMDLSPAEATLMILGLYEDTGMLTFSSVRGEDFEAGRWLLSRGADLNAVSVFLKRELNAQQVEMLNELLANLEFDKIGGVELAITSASTVRYIGDLSTLAHKIMDMENPNALFVMVRMDDRIHLIARSRVEAVNVGVIAGKLGGGGHQMASSATIKDMTLPQTLEKLRIAINDSLEPMSTAGEMMVEKVISVDAGSTIHQAQTLMTRFDVGGLPVVDDDKVMGIVTRQIVEKAVYHDMAEKPVADFMISEFEAVSPDTPVGLVEELILGRRQKFAPVVDPSSGKLVGVISRGMILSKLYGDSLKKPHFAGRLSSARRDPLSKDVRSLMKEMLPEKTLDLFGLISEVADENGCSAYVAGGFVRDLLLRAPSVDTDIVIEGDGIQFARKLALRIGGRIHTHEKFKTAVVTMPGGFKLDIATARIEYYPHPAALPVVKMSAIRNDLYRRDFSINAMAIRLNGPRPDMLIDFFGGQTDIKDHAIRVLHNLSFVEDPTRAFRAVRFEHRLGFSIGRQTLALLKSAIHHKLFSRLSSARLLTELIMILSERHPVGAIARIKQLGLLRFIHPGIRFDSLAEALMGRCEDILAWHDLTFPGHPAIRWRVFLMALVDKLDLPQIEELKGAYKSAKHDMDRMTDNMAHVRRAFGILSGKTDAPPSRLYELFAPMEDEALLYLAAKSSDGRIRDAVTSYLADIKDAKPLINGHDLLALGADRSEKIGSVLSKLMAAQLDGSVTNRDQALLLAKQMLENIKREKG